MRPNTIKELDEIHYIYDISHAFSRFKVGYLNMSMNNFINLTINNIIRREVSKRLGYLKKKGMLR